MSRPRTAVGSNRPLRFVSVPPDCRAARLAGCNFGHYFLAKENETVAA